MKNMIHKPRLSRLAHLAASTSTALSTALALTTLTALAGPIVSTTSVVVLPPEKGGSILDSIHLFGTARLRVEFADVDGFDDAHAASLRARYGIKTDPIAGFKFLIEGETTVILTDKSEYSAFPTTKGNSSVIADPDNFELNRFQLSYNIEATDTTITVGRQHITFADQRFIGAVGWRQNDQTFDAVVVENKSIENLTFIYAYIDQVNRIFGDQTPTQSLDRWEGESHLIHIEYDGIEDHTVRAFAYLLDFDETGVGRANSSDTYGLELQGENNKVNYLLTAAIQNDGGSNPSNYEECYYSGQISVKEDSCELGAGIEVMTSNGKNSFRFPLGTNHKFNGFADAYLTTPAAGLIDYYAFVGTKAFGLQHTLIVHNFHTESTSTELGWEFDYVAARKIGDNAKFILKAAHLMGDGPQVDITRASAEINYSF